MLKWPVGVTRRGSRITVLSLSVLSSTTTSADSWFFALHTANHTSSPALLYSGCTIRPAASPLMPAHSKIGSTLNPAFRFLMSKTATERLIFGSGLSGVST